jgi:hypothetical protein
MALRFSFFRSGSRAVSIEYAGPGTHA